MDQDQKIRQSYFRRDKDFNEKIKQEMEDEENMLKTYFKEYKKPSSEDSTVLKRQPPPERTAILKSMLSPFRVFGLFYDEYWSKEFATPQEKYAIKQCKDYTKKQMIKGTLLSVGLTSLVSYQMRMSVGLKVHLLSFMVGISSGLLYGVISSSQYSLERFEALGESYALGRSTLTQIQKYRMDKNI